HHEALERRAALAQPPGALQVAIARDEQYARIAVDELPDECVRIRMRIDGGRHAAGGDDAEVGEDPFETVVAHHRADIPVAQARGLQAATDRFDASGQLP